MLSSDLSDKIDEDDNDEGAEEFFDEMGRDVDEVGSASEEESVSSRRLYPRTWSNADDEGSIEDKGWEDWGEDQKRALGKSHERTMDTLEEASTKSTYTMRTSMASVMTKPTRRDPKGQILPTNDHFYAQERAAKNRLCNYELHYKRRNTFFTRSCIMLSAVGTLCFCGLMALTLLVPPGSLKETVFEREGKMETTTGSSPGFFDASLGENSLMHSIPHIKRNTEVASIEETTNSIYSFLRRKAFIIGNLILPAADDVSTIKFKSLEDFKILNEIEFPNYERLYSPINEPVTNIQPILWDTKRSGTNGLKDILTYCLKLVLASDTAQDHQDAQSLEIYSTADNTGRFANVNTETPEGLKRAQQIGLVDSGLVQVISTPYIAEASNLFANIAQTGRLFGIIRHPVEQAHSAFLYRKTLEAGNPELIPQELSVLQFVESDMLTTNWLTRTLLNITDDVVITEGHILGAKKILEERVLIGLTEAFDESVHRFMTYFGWAIQDPVCVSNFEAAKDNRDVHQQLSKETLEWKTLADRNYADMQLYEFAKSLFERQKEFISNNI